MTTETIDGILREMHANAGTLARKGQLGAADEWNDITDRIAKARAAELERFRKILSENVEALETLDGGSGVMSEHIAEHSELLALIDHAKEEAK